jgi:hypothetical protein
MDRSRFMRVYVLAGAATVLVGVVALLLYG